LRSNKKKKQQQKEKAATPIKMYKNRQGESFCELVFVDEDVDHKVMERLASMAKCELHENEEGDVTFVMHDNRALKKASGIRVCQCEWPQIKGTRFVMQGKALLDLIMEAQALHERDAHIFYIQSDDEEKSKAVDELGERTNIAIERIVEELGGTYIPMVNGRIREEDLQCILEYDYDMEEKLKAKKVAKIEKEEEEEEEEEYVSGEDSD